MSTDQSFITEESPRHVRRDRLRRALRLSKLPPYLRQYANDEGFGFAVPAEVFEQAARTTTHGRSSISDAAYWGLTERGARAGTD